MVTSRDTNSTLLPHPPLITSICPGVKSWGEYGMRGEEHQHQSVNPSSLLVGACQTPDGKQGAKLITVRDERKGEEDEVDEDEIRIAKSSLC